MNTDKKETLERVRGRLFGLAEKFKEDVFEISMIGRARLDIFSLRREAGVMYMKLGKKTHEMLGAGNIAQAELKAISYSIAEIEEKIKELEMKMTEISGTRQARKNAFNGGSEDL